MTLSAWEGVYNFTTVADNETVSGLLEIIDMLVRPSSPSHPPSGPSVSTLRAESLTDTPCFLLLCYCPVRFQTSARSSATSEYLLESIVEDVEEDEDDLPWCDDEE